MGHGPEDGRFRDSAPMAARVRRPVPAASPCRANARARGQSLVEFSLIVGPLLLLLLGVIQFGFIFNTYITLTNAVREAAREGSIYVYDRAAVRSVNDLSRNERIRTTLTGAMNALSKAAPQFANSSTWTSTTSGTTATYVTGDLTVTYTLPAGMTDNDPRQGYRVTVRAIYHQDILIPLIGNLLPKDAGGRLALTGETTMVIN